MANEDRERYKKELAAKKIYLDKRKGIHLEDVGIDKQLVIVCLAFFMVNYKETVEKTKVTETVETVV